MDATADPETSTSSSDTWIPKILSEYEIGRAVAAIEAVSRSDKPVAEVGGLKAVQAELEEDLRECLKLAKATGDVQFWVKPTGARFRYGFYKEPWVLGALDFLDQAQIGEVERAWISGLLFGYRASAIQQFIERETGRAL